ncbi:MAG: hypothetical protein IT285_02115 [Bdellovibrionales bacterium]|nr:hypothetical protein [Bdellovibrionales bacterium]
MSCSTWSNGKSFSSTGFDLVAARNSTIHVCRQTPYTDDLECEYNVQCGGAGAVAPVLMFHACSTSSNGRRFDLQTSNPVWGRNRVAQLCQANLFTNHHECAARAHCQPVVVSGPVNPGHPGHVSPNPGHMGSGYVGPCFGRCVQGSKCTDFCPTFPGGCNYLESQNVWRVVSCQ